MVTHYLGIQADVTQQVEEAEAAAGLAAADEKLAGETLTLKTMIRSSKVPTLVRESRLVLHYLGCEADVRQQGREAGGSAGTAAADKTSAFVYELQLSCNIVLVQDVMLGTRRSAQWSGALTTCLSVLHWCLGNADFNHSSELGTCSMLCCSCSRAASYWSGRPGRAAVPASRPDRHHWYL